MYTKYVITGASLVAAVLAGPLPQSVATRFAGQEGVPTHSAAPTGKPLSGPGGPARHQVTGPVITTSPVVSGVMPTSTASAATGSGAASTGAASSGSGTTTSVSVRESVTGPLAVTQFNDNDGKGSGSDAYKMYNGDGSAGAGWPAQSDWISYDQMFQANQALMKISCAQFSVPTNSDQENADIKSAIASVAQASKVDHRFILAIMMQESKGCVRVHTTNYGVRNPGLMQDHDGQSTCNDNNQVKTPCPKDQITGMISEGTGGTAAGPGLAQLINAAGGSDASTFYKAARAYNSGSVDASGDLGQGIATHCYASDVANRLMGWVQAPTGCTLDGKGSG